MTLRPMPVVMVSSLTQKGADAALRALELGAVDYVAKPTVGLADGFPRCATRSSPRSRQRQARPGPAAGAGAAKPAAAPIAGTGYRSSEKIIAIGASTGGVEALHTMLAALPADAPAILVTQHMPADVHRQLRPAARPAVRDDGDARPRTASGCCPATSISRPARHHLELARSGANYICRLHDQAPVSGHRPSVDVLFQSVARAAGANAVGIILTGMGKDGAAGLLAMRQAGASTIGQDEASCVIYGMPKAAHDCGATEIELPIGKIAEQALHRCQATARRGVRV